jgi:hypothetical protein
VEGRELKATSKRYTQGSISRHQGLRKEGTLGRTKQEVTQGSDIKVLEGRPQAGTKDTLDSVVYIPFDHFVLFYFILFELF